MANRGGDAILRAVNFSFQPINGYRNPGKFKYKKDRLVLVTGYGGGKWYNFYKDGTRGQSDRYSHLRIKDTPGPFSIYQCDAEHSLGKANIEINRASNISIYGLKSEGNEPVLRVKDSDFIQILGYGGNATALPGNSLFEVINSTNFLFVNLVDSPRLPSNKANHAANRQGVDPNLWYMLKDTISGNNTFYTKPLERPVLYKRDN